MSTFPRLPRLTGPARWGELLRALVIVALALFSANSLLYRLWEQGDELGWWVGLTATVVISGAFILHRRWPDATLSVVAVALTVCLFITEIRISIEAAAPVFYAAYLASAYSRRRWRPLWLGWLLAGTGAVVLTIPFSSDVLPRNPGQLLTAGLVTAMVWAVIGFFWLLGAQTRKRREDLAALRERAEMAGVVERTRIAREMHDIIAHNLSGIIALADGARYAAAKNPEVAADTLGTIATTGREALTQMRGLLSVLRTGDSREEHAAPGLPEISALIDDSRRAGLNVTVPGLEALPRELPDLAQFTVYRIVQEMLTNMLKHSTTSSGTLRIEATDRFVTLTSRNPADRGADTGAGYGLLGMAERVRAHDGRFTCDFDGEFFTTTAEVPR